VIAARRLGGAYNAGCLVGWVRYGGWCDAQLTANEREAAGRALLEALQYMAAHGIVHRDLKPANVLFSSDGMGARRLVVADFGLARLVTERARTTHGAGTPLFYAPEVHNRQRYGLAADVFSAGLHAPAYLTDCLRTERRRADNPAAWSATAQYLCLHVPREMLYLVRVWALVGRRSCPVLPFRGPDNGRVQQVLGWQTTCPNVQRQLGLRVLGANALCRMGVLC